MGVHVFLGGHLGRGGDQADERQRECADHHTCHVAKGDGERCAQPNCLIIAGAKVTDNLTWPRVCVDNLHRTNRVWQVRNKPSARTAKAITFRVIRPCWAAGVTTTTNSLLPCPNVWDPPKAALPRRSQRAALPQRCAVSGRAGGRSSFFQLHVPVDKSVRAPLHQALIRPLPAPTPARTPSPPSPSPCEATLAPSALTWMQSPCCTQHLCGP